MTSIAHTDISSNDYDSLPDKSGNYRVVEYYENGNMVFEKYLIINNVMHREDGPALIWYRENGTISIKSYYLFGQKFFEEDEYYSEKISLIRNMLSEVKDLDLKQKMFQSMYKVNQ